MIARRVMKGGGGGFRRTTMKQGESLIRMRRGNETMRKMRLTRESVKRRKLYQEQFECREEEKRQDRQRMREKAAKDRSLFQQCDMCVFDFEMPKYNPVWGNCQDEMVSGHEEDWTQSNGNAAPTLCSRFGKPNVDTN